MKKFIVVLSIIILGAMVSNAQVYVDGVNLDEMNVETCKVTITSYSNQKKIIQVNYGQKVKGFNKDNITDERGDKIVFYTEIGVINFMQKNNWELFYLGYTVGNDVIMVYTKKTEE